jgi:ethanolamine utilization protein EutN
MNVGKVAGTLVSTAKDPGMNGRKILLVRPLGGREKPLWALDAIGAGAGETVLYVRQREASYAFHPEFVPCDATIVGIVDHLWEDTP